MYYSVTLILGHNHARTFSALFKCTINSNFNTQLNRESKIAGNCRFYSTSLSYTNNKKKKCVNINYIVAKLLLGPANKTTRFRKRFYYCRYFISFALILWNCTASLLAGISRRLVTMTVPTARARKYDGNQA